MLIPSASQRVMCQNACQCNKTYVVTHFNKELLAKATEFCFICKYPVTRIGEVATGMTSYTMPLVADVKDAAEFFGVYDGESKDKARVNAKGKALSHKPGIRAKFRQYSETPVITENGKRKRTAVASGNDQRRLRKFERVK